MIKKSSGLKTASALIHSGPCLYYGFVCATGGSNRTISIYNSLSAAGEVVEPFVCDANKTMDGHEHSNPVRCATGLYLSMDGGSVVVYYWDLTEPTGIDLLIHKARLVV